MLAKQMEKADAIHISVHIAFMPSYFLDGILPSVEEKELPVGIL